MQHRRVRIDLDTYLIGPVREITDELERIFDQHHQHQRRDLQPLADIPYLEMHDQPLILPEPLESHLVLDIRDLLLQAYLIRRTVIQLIP